LLKLILRLKNYNYLPLLKNLDIHYVYLLQSFLQKLCRQYNMITPAEF